MPEDLINLDSSGIVPPKESTKPKRVTAKKMCSKVIKREGVKTDGTLKKGYKYVKGGRVVKVAPAKKPATKRAATTKKTTAKRKTTTKKKSGILGLGILGIL